MKTLAIILTDGLYISQYAEMAYKIASEALKLKAFQVNIFLYLDAVQVPKRWQKPSLFADTGQLFQELAERGAVVRACARCAAARGYSAKADGGSPDYLPGIKISSLYELVEMLKNSDKVMALSR